MLSLSPSSLSLACIRLVFVLLTTSVITVPGFQVDERTSTLSPSDKCDDDEIDLFAWAIQHGAKIADSIEIRATPYGGRGLFAKTRIPENTELIQIPYHLQLGVRQLAEGTDEEMQRTARSLPWEYIRENELFFVPLSVALVAERRKGADESIFWPFLQSLPGHCPNAMGTALDEGGNIADDGLRDLLRWAPHVASKVRRRREGIRSLHDAIAPPSLSLDELLWAATNVCSRSLVRKRVMELAPDEVERIGAFSASDHSRMLPVVDLVNHGPRGRANVWVGHLSREGGGGDDDDFSTSLKSTRDIEAGEELLFDYGGEEAASNDRLLLDYGFVLPEHADRVSMGLDELEAAISVLEEGRAGMRSVPREDVEGLEALIAFLTRQASEAQNGVPLLFTADGEPTTQTLAVAVAMTCRGQDDVTRALEPVRQITPQHGGAGSLPGRIVDGAAEMQKEFARFALKRAAGLALVQRSPLKDESNNKENCDMKMGAMRNSFASVAREYSTMCRGLLHKVADMSR